MNRSSKLKRWAAVLALALGTGTAFGEQVVRIVPRGSVMTVLPGQEILPGFPFDPQFVSFTTPTRGNLTENANGLIYEPGPEFWQAGIDSFRIHHVHALPSEKTVHLVADLKVNPLAPNPLAGCQLDPQWTLVGNTSSIVSGGYDSECLFRFDLASPFAAYVISPEVQTGPGGGNTTVLLDPGGNHGPGNPSSLIDLPAGFEEPIAAGVLTDGTALFELVLREGPELIARARRSDGTVLTTAALPFSYELQQIELNWWFASSAEAADGGLLVIRDGELEATLGGIDNFAFLGLEWEWEYGLPQPIPGASGILDMVPTGLWVSSLPPIYEPLFTESASDGSLVGWSDVANDSKIAIVTTNGDPELSLTISAGEAVTLRDDSPTAELHYRASFVLGLDDLQSLTGARWTLFAGERLYDASSYPPFALEVRRALLGGGFEIRATAQDSRSQAITSWVPISASQSRVAVGVQWWASQGWPAANGGLVLSLGHNVVATLQGLRNQAARVDQTYLGATDVSLGILGEIVLDDFIAWR